MKFKEKFKQFSYLYNLEVLTSLKIVVPALVMILIFRISFFTRACNSVKNSFFKYLHDDNGNLEIYFRNYDKTSQSGLYSNQSGLYSINNFENILILGIALVAIYAVIVWLKEWMGNNRTVYSMMTLPISKSITLLFKLFTCLNVFVMFCATQVLALLIEKGIFSWIIPKEIMQPESLIETILKTKEYGLLLVSFRDIIFLTLGLLVIITVIFTVVLLERSFGLISLVASGALVWALIIIASIPMMFNLFAGEMVLFLIIYSIAIIVLGFVFCKFLLEKKVHV